MRHVSAFDYILLTARYLSSFACLERKREKLAGCARIAVKTLEQEFD